MAVINIDDAYILNETGAQVDKVTGLFTKDEDTTSGEKAFAQLNIGTAGSNRNLLDNSFFTVRQRGDGPFTSGYTADRWVTQSTGASISFGNNGATITLGSASYAVLTETFDLGIAQALAGETVTASVKMADGTIFSGQMVMLASGMDANLYFAYNGKTVRINCYTTASAFLFRMLLYGDMTIRAVKLELGSVSTLANDAPPDYDEELLKCLRYQWIVDAESVYGVVGDATVTTQNTEAMMVVHYPVPMYKVPTLSVSGVFRTVGGNGSSIQIGSVTSMAVTSNSSNKNFARVTINGTNMGNTGTSVVVGANNSASAKLIFDANI